MSALPDRPPRSRARPALPTSFLADSSPSPPRPSTAASSSPDRLTDAPSAPAGSSGEEALGVTLDGSFVETTSEAAARAVAQFYALEDGSTAVGAGQRGAGQYGVQTRIDSRGRTVYRVRPIADSPTSSPTDAASTSSSPPAAHHPFARPSHHPQPPPPPPQHEQPTIALHRSSLLRTSRSIPLFRAPRTDIDPHPHAHEHDPAALHPSAAGTSPRLRKAPSSPSLRGAAPAGLRAHEHGHDAVVYPAHAAPTQRARTRSAAAGAGSRAGEGDVLGRILGWRVDVPAAHGSFRSSAAPASSGAGVSGGTRRRVKSPSAGAGAGAGAGAARVGLPEMFRLGTRKGSKGSRGEKLSGSAVIEAGTDRSDLPEDLVDELDAVSVFDTSSPSSPSSSPIVEADHPFASPKQRPSYLRRPTGPFGTGVRIHRSPSQPVVVPALVTPAPALAPATAPHALTHAMREVSSSDSIRTARADDPQPLLPPAPIDDARSPAALARRFEDPSIFDVFHRPFPSLPSSPIDSSPSRQPHAIPFGAHGRLPSSASLASSHSARSDHSHASATAHDITVVPAPGDDPRFVIWGVKEPPAPAAAATTSPRGVGAGKGGRRPSFAPGTPRAAAGAGEQGSPQAQASSPGSARTRWSIGARSGSGTASTASAGASAASSPATSLRNSVASASSHGSAQRVLMAATVERLVAELTSQIAPELLADFFLTYRHYLAPLSLLHLLIARFEWSMPPSSTLTSSLSSAPPAPLSPEDDALRRVVRVRTFVVLRYWLLNHFMDDFYPSRALRTALTTWLNDSARDERFRQSPRDLRLVKGLKKTARRCKERFILGATAAASSAPAPAVAHSHAHGPAEDEVDLELGGTGGARHAPAAPAAPHAASPSTGFASLRSRAGLSAALHSHHDASSSSSAAASAALDSAAAASTEHDAHGPAGAGPGGALARGVSTALGTLGRFRRKLKERATTTAHAHDASPGGTGGARGGEREELEFEQRGETDLLWVRGGVDAYLRYWGVDVPQEDVAAAQDEGVGERTPEMEHAGEEGTPSTADENGEALTPRPADAAADAALDLVEPVPPVLADEGVGLGIVAGVVDDPPSDVAVLDQAYLPSPKAPLVAHFDAPAPPLTTEPYTFSLAPGAFTSLAASPPPFPSSPSSHRPESVRIELDDLDDSDDDMDDDVIEAKRTLKRLPAATNLRLAAAGVPQRRSPSVGSEASSYGFAAPHAHGAFDWSLGGVRGGEDDGLTRESISFLDDEAGSTLSAAAVIPNFVLDGLFDSDDDDEPGDVEAALRRLEGLVDESREDEKKKRVERQMDKSGKLDEERRGEIDRLEKDAQRLDAEYAVMRRMSLSSTSAPDSPAVAPAPPQREAAVVDLDLTHVEPVPFDGAGDGQAAVLSSSPPTKVDPPPARPNHLTVSPPPSTAAAVDTLRKPSVSHIFGIPLRPLSARPGLPTSFTLPLHPHRGPAPPSHRSFVLSCRTDVLAAQFTLVERDLLRMLSYQELVSGSWRERIGAAAVEPGAGETDVQDWEAYVKERRRRDFEAARDGRSAARTSAVQDVIARFNLTANWVCSEILLTAEVHERAMLIAKFIRLAFKCYCQGNLQTLTQIIHGLQLDDVDRLHKTWARVPAWEMRKFRGMQAFASHLRNFKHLRVLMSAMVDEYGGSAVDDGETSSSASSVPTSTSTSHGKGCIPFLGLFLRDLALTTELPTYLDPSSPSSPALVSPAGLLTSLSLPSSFAHLPALPSSTPLAPLVNVHKFRLLAGIVGRVVTFQRLAARYAHEPSRGAYWRCLKIRCLDVGVARELSRRLEP